MPPHPHLHLPPGPSSFLGTGSPGTRSLSITGMQGSVAAGQAQGDAVPVLSSHSGWIICTLGDTAYAPKETCQGCHEILRPVGKEVTFWSWQNAQRDPAVAEDERCRMICAELRGTSQPISSPHGVWVQAKQDDTQARGQPSPQWREG